MEGKMNDTTTLEKPSEPATTTPIEGMVLAEDPELRAAQLEVLSWPAATWAAWALEFADLVDRNPAADKREMQLEAYRRVVATPAYRKRKAERENGS
jgi:hypothetical protein